MNADLAESGRAALTALDRALGDPPEQVAENLPEAVRALVGLRDRLIERRRANPDAPGAGICLQRANAILSATIGGEYPMVGVRKERLKEARDALARLLEELAKPPG